MASRKVYTSGTSRSDTALNRSEPKVIGMDAFTKRGNFRGIQPPTPSQKYTFQRGLARATLELPERERATALAELLAMMGLLERYMPRWTD